MLRTFTMFDSSANHNKQWSISYTTESYYTKYQTFFGRVGQKQNTKGIVEGTIAEIEALIRSKENKGYRELKLHEVMPQIVSNNSTIIPEVAKLFDYIKREAGNYINTYLTTKVDALSVEQLNEGRKWLQEVIRAQTSNFSLYSRREAVRRYYQAIPTKMPRRIDIDLLVTDFNAPEQEDRLNQLEASLANIQAPTNTVNIDTLGVECSVVEKDSPEWKRIIRYINATAIHGYKILVTGIYNITIPVERKAFELNPIGKSKVEQLWHGTRNPNVMYILKSGLIIPKAVANGSMFGRGVYFANKASKSGNYCNGSDDKILFLNDVAMGESYVAPHSTSFTMPPKGYDSVFGKAKVTKFDSVGGRTLDNDEIIVYAPKQQSIRYLITWKKG